MKTNVIEEVASAAEKNLQRKTKVVIEFHREISARKWESNEEIIEAIALTLAYDCALPSELVTDIGGYWKTLNGDAHQIAMELNEVAVIDFNLLMSRIGHFYMLRYQSAFSLPAFITNVAAKAYTVKGDEGNVLRLAGDLRSRYTGC